MISFTELRNIFNTACQQAYLVFKAKIKAHNPMNDELRFVALHEFVDELPVHIQVFGVDMFTAGFLAAKSEEVLPKKDDPDYEQRLVDRISALNTALNEAKQKYDALGKSASIRSEVLNALRENDQIVAVRLYRQRTGSTLREAMDFVKSLA